MLFNSIIKWNLYIMLYMDDMVFEGWNIDFEDKDNRLNSYVSVGNI